MQNTTMKRFSMVAVAFVAAMALGACADEPIGPSEPYEVQMTEETQTDATTDCYYVAGQLICQK